ncbi:MAG: hypothetical protein RSA12_01250 [Clostridia bacterium]
MKVKYTGDYYRVSLKKEKAYEVLSHVDGFYCLIDESGEEYAFPDKEFEIVKPHEEPTRSLSRPYGH